MNKHRQISLSYFLTAIFSLIIFMQFFGLFRIAVIFDSTIYSLPLQLGLLCLCIWLYLSKAGSLRLNKTELALATLPFLMIPWGIYNNPLDRHIFSEPILIALFIASVAIFRSNEIPPKIWRKGAILMLYSLSAFLLLVFGLQASGVKLFSIAKTSIYFVFPCFYFLFNREHKKFFISILAIVLATKRSLLFAIPFAYVFYFFLSAKYKYQSKAYVGFIMIGLLTSLMIFFSNSKMAGRFPGHLSDLYYKIALINPISDNFDISDDYRVREVLSAYDQSMDSPLNALFGKGPGFRQDVYRKDGSIWFEHVYNTHFTFMAIWAKYGILYLMLLASYLFQVFRAGWYLLKNRPEDKMAAVFFCFFMSSFFEVLTSYSLFINILNFAVMGQLFYKYNKTKNPVSPQLQNNGTLGVSHL